MFLMACWMPVTAWPMAANFCDWISSRCSFFSWVMSLLIPMVPIGLALAVAQTRQRQQDVADLAVLGQQAGLVVLDVAGRLQSWAIAACRSRGSAKRLSIGLPITSSRR